MLLSLSLQCFIMGKAIKKNSVVLGSQEHFETFSVVLPRDKVIVSSYSLLSQNFSIQEITIKKNFSLQLFLPFGVKKHFYKSQQLIQKGQIQSINLPLTSVFCGFCLGAQKAVGRKAKISTATKRSKENSVIAQRKKFLL